MFTKAQLDFIRGSLTQSGAAVPCADNGKVARLFLATLDEIDAQLKELEVPPKLQAVPDSAG